MFSKLSAPRANLRDIKLDLELFGMLSDREIEEKLMAGPPELPPGSKPEAEPEEPPVPPPDEPLPEPVAAVMDIPLETEEYPLEPDPLPAVESPVVIPAARTVVETAAAGAAPGSGVFQPSTETGIGGGGSGGRDAVNQRGETRGRAGEGDAVSLYTARVARRLQSNLVYPEKMRRNGIEAATTIVFTVTELGQIKKDSLQVRKSSGYKEMDDNALRAARDSAPFGEPPKEMTLVIDVAFEVGRSRR